VVISTTTHSFQVIEDTAHVDDADRRMQSVLTPSLKLAGLLVPKIWQIFGNNVNRPGDLDLLPFDLCMGSRVTGVMDFLPAEFQLPVPIRSRLR